MVNIYRTDRQRLESILESWAQFVKSRVRLVACGGTALTLLNLKESTKDIDFIVPVEDEYRKLISVLQSIGYRQVTGYGWGHPQDNLIFDLYYGNRIFTTELIESPLLRGNSTKWRIFKKLEIYILNPYDLIISKMFRGDATDIEDSVVLIKSGPVPVNLDKLFRRYKETAAYEVQEEKVIKNFGFLVDALKENAVDVTAIEREYHQWRQKRRI